MLLQYRLILSALIVVFSISFSRAQTPDLISNTTEKDKANSFLYKNLNDQYDLLIGYTDQCYWWSNIEDYKLIALKNGDWFKGYIFSKRSKKGVWSKPKLSLQKADKEKVLKILDHLNGTHFWMLNRDSLNVTNRKEKDGSITEFSISDVSNYQFEILSKNYFVIIASYAPEYFLEKMPEQKSRERFIENKEWFLEKYKEL